MSQIVLLCSGLAAAHLGKEVGTTPRTRYIELSANATPCTRGLQVLPELHRELDQCSSGLPPAAPSARHLGYKPYRANDMQVAHYYADAQIQYRWVSNTSTCTAEHPRPLGHVYLQQLQALAAFGTNVPYSACRSLTTTPVWTL